jgi:hypothetical protein
MAHLHTRRMAYKSGGEVASKRVSYITRQPVRELSRVEQQLQYLTDGRREDLVFTQHRNLPTWAHDDPHGYFQAAERYERAGGVAFEEWKMTMPHELTHGQNMALMRDLVDQIAGHEVPCVYAFHDPQALSGARQQPHLHLLLSSRKTDDIARTPAQHFKRYNRAHPERGGAEKDAAFYHRGAVKAQRVLISDLINLHLGRHGHTVRIHPDSLAERGMDRAPEPKLLPSESREYRQNGIVSKHMQQVLDTRAQREQLRPRERDDAQRYWVERKRALGITPNMPHAQRLARVRQAREAVIHARPAPNHPTARELEATAQDLQREITGLEGFVVQVGAERRAEERATRQGRERPVAEQWHAEAVLAEGKRHGLPRDPEAERAVRVAAAFARKDVGARVQDLLHDLAYDDAPTAGAALRVRIFDREHDRDGGMSW